MDRDQFLRDVVDRKYGVYVVNGVQLVEGYYGVGVWKYIRGRWDLFPKLVRYQVGDGTHI